MSRSSSAPSSPFVRGSILGAAVARASATKAGARLSAPFRSSAAKARAKQETDENAAKVIFDACTALRGTPLKLVQVLATEEELLPEAYRARFSLATHQVEPINRALVQKILRVELGDPVSVFRDFEDVPFAAASLGQVHAATTHDGEPLALKLQYPGVAASVSSDLRLARALLRPTAIGPLFEGCFEELGQRLAEELDYCVEAANCAWFRENLSLPGLVVPRVYPEYGTARVIATERLTGTHLAEFLATGPTQEERNHYGQLLVDLFHLCVYELHTIHADPNSGNYLFLKDGKLGLIDFGCVVRLDGTFVRALRRCFADDAWDGATIRSLHAELGVHYRDDADPKKLDALLMQWRRWLLEPYRCNAFDYGQNREYFARGFAFSEQIRSLLGRYDGAFAYFGRAHHGLMRLLQSLEATVTFPRPLHDSIMGAPCR